MHDSHKASGTFLLTKQLVLD